MCAQNEITSLQIEEKTESHNGAVRNKICIGIFSETLLILHTF